MLVTGNRKRVKIAGKVVLKEGKTTIPRYMDLFMG